MSRAQAFYIDTGASLTATPHTRGPWSPDHQHAGPPAALLARAIEAALPADPPMQVVRMTLEILRPVPIAALTASVDIGHDGRRLKLFDAQLRAAGGKGKLLIRARALAIRNADLPVPPAPDPFEPPPPPAASTPVEFPFFTGDVGYHKAMEVRIASGAIGEGPVTAWMRMRLPLVAGEQPSPLQRVMVAADSGNGVSMVLDFERYTFVNPDLTAYVHRLPAGEWVCLQAHTLPQGSGIGLADTRLYDERGPIGRAAQSLIIQQR